MASDPKLMGMNVQDVLKDAETKMTKALESLSREFASIRTGRASPALVDGIRADYFGTPTPLKQLANITASDPKMLLIQPWDVNAIQEIEKALLKSELGLQPLVDGKVIRIPIPPLSTERRQELTKLAHKVSEEGRVSVRNIRHGAKESIEKLFKDKSITEDDKFKNLDQLQKLTDRYDAKISETLTAKEADLKTV